MTYRSLSKELKRLGFGGTYKDFGKTSKFKGKRRLLIVKSKSAKREAFSPLSKLDKSKISKAIRSSYPSSRIGFGPNFAEAFIESPKRLK